MKIDKTDQYPWDIVTPHIIDISLFIIMIVITLISLIASYYSFRFQGDWFQRSGSIIVLIAAVIEYRHLNFYSTPSQKSVISGGISGVNGLAILSKIRLRIGVYAIFYLVAGTLIWGYGDIPFK